MADKIVSQRVIYAIKNIDTGKSYIGSTVNFVVRKRAHLSLLRSGKHHSIKLQRAWEKHGEHAFAFLVIKEVPSACVLHVEEQSIIDSLNTAGDGGYNIARCVSSPMSGRKHTEESKAKIGKAFAGIPKKRPLVQKGDKIPRCTVEKIARANTGKKRSEETRRKLSECAKGHLRWLGKTHTEETKRKISEKAKARKHPSGWHHSEKTKSLLSSSKRVPVEIDGIVFGSYREAAQHYGKDNSCIGYWVKKGKARKLDVKAKANF